jgi:hypothetical protein
MVERRAGQYGREVMRGIARGNLLALGSAVAAGVAIGVLFGFRGPAFIGAEIAVILCAVFIDRVVVPELERRGRGVKAEEEVGAMLDALVADGWRVLHDLDTGRGNIDHVVVGPGGVFTVETKSHGGRIPVDSIEEGMWKQAYAQAMYVSRATGAKVTPLLVFSRAYLVPGKARRRGVTVLPARFLEDHLLQQRARLSPPDIERLTGALLSR